MSDQSTQGVTIADDLGTFLRELLNSGFTHEEAIQIVLFAAKDTISEFGFGAKS